LKAINKYWCTYDNVRTYPKEILYTSSSRGGRAGGDEGGERKGERDVAGWRMRERDQVFS